MEMVLLGDWFGFVLIREQFSWGKFYWLCKHELYNSLTYFLSPNLWWTVLTSTFVMLAFSLKWIKVWIMSFKNRCRFGKSKVSKSKTMWNMFTKVLIPSTTVKGFRALSSHRWWRHPALWKKPLFCTPRPAYPDISGVSALPQLPVSLLIKKVDWLSAGDVLVNAELMLNWCLLSSFPAWWLLILKQLMLRLLP